MTDLEPTSGERDEISAISALGDPKRRALYDYVVDAGRWVGRDEAADAIGLERATATHHLERLLDAGLLDIDYRRLTGRKGPGAGRTAKLYRRSAREFEVNLPPRAYELAGRLLAGAADRAASDGIEIIDAINQVADSEGRRISRAGTGQSHEDASSCGAGSGDATEQVNEVLENVGYEPCSAGDGTLILRNCPFHDLAQEHTDLICRMNLRFVSAIVDELGANDLEPRLEPDADHCCVKLHPQD